MTAGGGVLHIEKPPEPARIVLSNPAVVRVDGAPTWTAGWLPRATGGATVGAVTSSQGNAWDAGCRFDFETPTTG